MGTVFRENKGLCFVTASKEDMRFCKCEINTVFRYLAPYSRVDLIVLSIIQSKKQITTHHLTLKEDKREMRLLQSFNLLIGAQNLGKRKIPASEESKRNLKGIRAS